MKKLALALALMMGSAGCATVGTLQTARPIERGTVQVGLEPSVQGGARLLPKLNVAVRYGMGDRWDLGARVGADGVGLTGKFALSGPRYQPGLAVALAPAVGGFRIGGFGMRTGSAYAQLPLLIGVPFGRGNELVVGPKVADWMFFHGGPGFGVRNNVMGVGASVGVSWQVAPGVTLLPEVSMIRPLAGGGRTRVLFVDVGHGEKVPLYQVSFAILLGGGEY